MARKDQHITLAAARLEELTKQVADLHLKAAGVIEEIAGIASASEIESLVASTPGLGLEEFRLIRCLSTLPDDVRKLLPEAKLSLEAARLLAVASPEVQDQVAHYLRHNKHFDVADLHQLTERHRRDSLEARERLEHDRFDFLRTLAADRWAAIESAVEQLQVELGEFAEARAADPDQWPDEPFEFSPEYNKSFDEISSRARRVLVAVEGIIGDADLASYMSDEAAKLVSARKALQRLADGAFAHNGGFSFETISSRHFATDLSDAIGYLAAGEARPVAPIPPRPLKVLELFAGAGGSAIGLMGAGFDHVALIEKSKDRAKTLKSNWPTWNVINADIFEISEAALRRYHGVDLLAAGLPCAPADAREDRPDLFAKTLDVLEVVSPRSFMLQYDKGQRQKAQEQGLAKLMAGLKKDGRYRLFRFVLDPNNFGLPHSREHQFIVGIHNEVLGAFLDPSALAPTIRDVLEVLGPLVRRGRKAIANVAPTHPQRIFNRWADIWESARKESNTKLLPTLPREMREAGFEAWLKAGFNPTQLAARLPAVGDREIVDGHFVPFLTAEVLAVAQGFPENWKFLAEKHGILGMIADALPPVISKVVGLAIRSVLCGKPLDLNNAITERIIDTARIGIGKFELRLNGPRRRWPLEHTKASPWIRSQAERVIRGEEISLVEPNHMLRGRIRAEMESVHQEWEFLIALEQEDEEEEWHSPSPQN